MQIVIDIPEKIYNNIQSMDWKNDIWAGDVYRAIHNGTPLPQGHGRLIDANELPRDIDWQDIDNAPTVIAADKGDFR